MICLHCNRPFTPDPPRRRVCPSCVASRPRRVANQGRRPIQSATKPAPVQLTVHEAFSLMEAHVRREWKRKNLIDFPVNRIVRRQP